MAAVEVVSLLPDLVKILIRKHERLGMHLGQPGTALAPLLLRKELVFRSQNPKFQKLQQMNSPAKATHLSYIFDVTLKPTTPIKIASILTNEEL